MVGRPHSLIAWNAAGEIVATLDHVLVLDEDRNPIGLVDFEAHEQSGGRLRDIWENSRAVGSGTWPEWLNPADFTVELEADPSPARARIKALIHRESGHRRERAAIEAEIERREKATRDEARQNGGRSAAIKRALGLRGGEPRPKPVDLRDLLGGPGKPLFLDENGRTMPRPKRKPVKLPVLSRSAARPETQE